MSLKVQWTAQFKKDYRLAMKRGLKIEALDDTIRMLANEMVLPPKYCDHALTLSRTGTHSDLFNK